MMRRAASRSFYFMTGELGYQALEPLREALGGRFINCGVAEQNMIGVAAGLARDGHEVWVYSIGPFCYARPFEQIRNDVALQRLPVRLIGNGGGYGYGVMGPTHHSLEDYGVLLTLPAMTVFVPARNADLEACIQEMGAATGPSYLRLGIDEFGSADLSAAPFAAWRRSISGEGAVAVTCGAIAGAVHRAAAALPEASRPDVWVVARLPFTHEALPPELTQAIAGGRGLVVAEEHTAHGGVAGALARALLLRAVPVRRFRHLCASGYPSGRYGSQAYHRRESGLHEDGIRQALEEVRQ